MTLIICSKSEWSPAIRREHALAQTAAAHGHAVIFVERPIDARALRRRSGRRRWLRTALSRPRRGTPGSVEVVRTATVVPGHRSDLTQRLDARRLLFDLRSFGDLSAATVVATQPWQWPAVQACGASRRVFDCADDWGALLPGRRAAIARLQLTIGEQASAVIAASDDLRDAFDTQITVVPNGTGDALLRPPLADRDVHGNRMLYTGTLSERFDTELVRDVLALLPEWTLDIYGQAQYAGRGSEPAPELAALIEWAHGRVAWHAPVNRDELATVIDTATVAVIPHRLPFTHGQDSMKLYDYAARARPVVATHTTRAVGGAARAIIGGVESAAAFADAVTTAASVSDQSLRTLRSWAEQQSWDARWPDWQAPLFGAPCAS
jgi:glycosyltransferase involved in cell wall biosynthesis